jgi:hypothetical protein
MWILYKVQPTLTTHKIVNGVMASALPCGEELKALSRSIGIVEFLREPNAGPPYFLTCLLSSSYLGKGKMQENS